MGVQGDRAGPEVTLSDTIRERLAAEVGPCHACGHPRMTIAALAKDLEMPATSVGRYLAGGKPSVALLDAADAYLEGLRHETLPMTWSGLLDRDTVIVKLGTEALT